MSGPSHRVTRTKTVERTLRSLVIAADPDFEAEKRREPEYEFSNGRVFRANRNDRHPYNIAPSLQPSQYAIFLEDI